MAHLPLIEGVEPDLPGRFPVLPLRDTVFFPFQITPLFVGRRKSILAVEHALETDRFLFLTAQRDLNIESPTPEDLYTVGAVCLLLRILRVKESDKMKILIQGLRRAEIRTFLQNEPFFMAEVEEKITEISENLGAESQRLMTSVKERLDELIFTYGKPFPADILVVLETLEYPDKLAHLIAANIGLTVAQAQEILETGDPMQKLRKVGGILDERISIFKDEKARKEPDK